MSGKYFLFWGDGGRESSMFVYSTAVQMIMRVISSLTLTFTVLLTLAIKSVDI